MSIKKPQLILIVFLLIGWSAYKLLQAPDQLRRSFATGINVSQFSSHGIVDRVINLKISIIHADSTNDQVEVVAEVALPFDFDGALEYKWILGQGVILKEGQLRGKTNILFTKDSVQKIKLRVNGFSPENLRHIGFEIFGTKNGRRLFAEGLISSQLEKSFEKTVQRNSGIKK